MRVAQKNEKHEISNNIKKVQEMQEMQTNYNYVAIACDKYGVSIADAHSPRTIPKPVDVII